MLRLGTGPITTNHHFDIHAGRRVIVDLDPAVRKFERFHQEAERVRLAAVIDEGCLAVPRARAAFSSNVHSQRAQ